MHKGIPKNYFKILNNEMRRQIIRSLSREKIVTFTQIMNLLELDPLWQCGTISYHLNLLVDSGILRKYEDGYLLTSKGRSLVNMIEKIECLEVDKKLNKFHASEKILETLNPRFVCWLLAVAKGVKPVATILSVAKDNWAGFIKVLNELDLCWVYKGINGMVLNCPKNEAEELFGSLSLRSKEDRVSFLFNDKNWAKFLYEKKASFQILSSSSAKLTPVVHQDLDIREIVVSRNLESLIAFAQFNRRTEKPACWSKHIERGKALGYPDCCIEAYEKGGKVGLVARHNFFKGIIDLGLDDRMPVEFWAIAHIPCSPECKESIALGRKYLDAVKLHSPSLFDVIVEKLRVSYLPYSVGERFLSFREIPQDQFSLELKKEYNRILNWAKKIVSKKVKVTLGNVQRPLVYADVEDYPVRCRLVPELMGLKWIACSPGEGVLVRDVKTNEVYLCLLLKWVLPNEYEKIINTVCRIYRCN